MKIAFLCLFNDKAMPFGPSFSDKNTLFYVKCGKSRGKFIQTSEKKNIIIVNVSFCRYNLLNVDKGLLLKLHRTMLLQSAQFNMRVSKIV